MSNVEDALKAIMDAIEAETGPKDLSKAEYAELLEELLEDVRSRLTCVREELEAEGEGGGDDDDD